VRRRLTILGSTGSIGLQALDVVRSHRERFEIVGLSAGENAKKLREQAEEFNPTYVALESIDADTLGALETEKFTGLGASARLASAPADVVLNGIVGFAGLASTVRALESGNTVALANKESLVAGGDWVMGLAESTPVEASGAGSRIIPVDSEHSAIFQCLEGRETGEVREILLTASGGPFFGYSEGELSKVGPEDALKHPTWRMGPKITIDSATMMNKGLEAIEAHHLFRVPYDRIRITVHRQSVVHGGVVLEDGSAILHAALPDMRLPISYGVLYPERVDVGAKRVGFAMEAGRAGGAYPVALNAANEVAVTAFLDRRIEFLWIARVIEEVLETVPEFGEMKSVEAVVDADRWGRERAEKAIGAAR
jgi:1-deoxy-D-xylulose-5-phosphate reductoisomerase